MYLFCCLHRAERSKLQVPRSIYRGRSLTALYRGSVQDFFKSKSLYRQKSLEFFRVPESIQRKRSRNFSKSQDIHRGKSSEFFQVPRPSQIEDLGTFPSPRAYTMACLWSSNIKYALLSPILHSISLLVCS